MAGLAIATKDISIGRLAVKAGEPLPKKYQVTSAQEWVKQKYGADSLRIASTTRLTHKDLEKEFEMVCAHRDELIVRVNELERRLKSQTGTKAAGMKEHNGNSQG